VSFEYWFMLPIAALVATTAMASGVGGATFFAPIFMLGLGLEPEVAIGTGLMTEVFGFGSGLLAYWRKKLIDYRLGTTLLIATVPAALLGTWAAGVFDPDILKVILGVGLFAVAGAFLRAPDHEEVARADGSIEDEASEGKATSCLVTAEGESIRYSVCNRAEGSLIAGVGGLFVGLISTGLGELNTYFLMQRCRVPSRVAVATSVFVVAITALTASVGHFAHFVDAGPETLELVFSLVIFTIPGVIIGGQIGPMVANRIPQKQLERGLGVLFIIVATLTLGEVLLHH